MAKFPWPKKSAPKYPCLCKLLHPITAIAAAPTRIPVDHVVAMGAAASGTSKTTEAECKKEILRLSKETRHQLLSNLYGFIGVDRTVELYKCEVQQHHFLLIYADENRDVGEKMRDQLLKMGAELGHDELSVVGPWDVQLGEIILSTWERLSRASQQVVVLLSRALLQNPEITQCLMKMDISLITPVYLEPLTSNDLPLYLASLTCRNGYSAHHDQWDLHIFVKDLLAHYDFDKHLEKEITILEEVWANRDTIMVQSASEEDY